MVSRDKLRALAVAVCVSLNGAAMADDRLSEYTSSQLRHQLKESHDRIRAFSIEYQGAAGGVSAYNHRTLAARYPASCFYQGAKGRTGFDWRSDLVDEEWNEDAFRNSVLITSTDCHWSIPFSREFWDYPLAPDAPMPAKVQTELIFVALGWWPFEQRPGPKMIGGGPVVIPEIAASGAYRVRPSQELYGGHWCHVLERPGYDALWLDCERDCLILRRELYDVKTGGILQRLEMTRYRESAPGIWVPREIRNIHFDRRVEADSATNEAKARRVMEAKIQVLEAKLNGDVPGSLFQPQPKPAGALEWHSDGRWSQVRDGGFDYMDELAGWLKERARFSAHVAVDSYAIVDYITMIVALIIIVVCRRR